MHHLVVPSASVLAILSLVAMASSHCDSTGSSCTAMDFTCNQTTVTLTPPPSGWTAGAYALSYSTLGGDAGASADGGSGNCTLVITDPARADTSQALCGPDPATTMAMVPVQDCASRAAGCDGADCCTTVPGLFGMVVTLPGLPSQIAVTLSRDGSQLASTTVAPAPASTEPNGAGCGVCTNGAAAFTPGGAPDGGGGD